MTKPKPVSSFRDNLAELEEITQALESETIDL
jgi:exonuclease VII small subunit